MKCEKCGNTIINDDKYEYHGQILCEDCYMDALSPAKTCDPWAVYTAKSLYGKEICLNETQEKILKILVPYPLNFCNKKQEIEVGTWVADFPR